MKPGSFGSLVRKLLLTALVLAVGVSGAALAKPHKKPRKVHNTTGIAYVTGTHTEGDDGYVSGDFKDSYLGRGALVYVVNVGAGPDPGTIRLTAKRITFYTKRGSLSGTGSATVSGNDVTDGVFKLTKGTGRYRGHTFKGTFSGSYSDEAGVYTFNEKGRFK